MVEKLLPCPFCGASASIERLGDRSRSTIYQCDSCSCSLETGEEWRHGSDWNRRAIPPDGAPMNSIAAFEAAYPHLYWHIAKGKISAGEPLYAAIITTVGATEIGHGESNVSADDAFSIAAHAAGLTWPLPEDGAINRVEKGTCPGCGRLKAKNAADAARGLCPKWWASRDEMAEKDCERYATATATSGAYPGGNHDT